MLGFLASNQPTVMGDRTSCSMPRFVFPHVRDQVFLIHFVVATNIYKYGIPILSEVKQHSLVVFHAKTP